MVEKILDQAQIDAMVQAARGGKTADAKVRQKKITAWDARQAGQIGREQMQAISLLHEGFARNLTHSLGAYLRVAFNAALVSAEHLTYVEFLQRMPEVTYLASLKLEPVAAVGLLQLDLAIAFPLIDVLLGGEGKGAPPAREITEIEEQILETVGRIICRELQAAWHALALEFQFERRQQPQQVQQLMPAEEKTLSLSFEITVAESRGTMNLVVPAVVSNALLRKLSLGWMVAKRRVRPDSDGRLKRRLLDCPFRLELCVPGLEVAMSKLAQVASGDLLVFSRRVERPAVLLAAGRPAFTAAVVRQAGMRAGRLLARAQPGTKEEGK
jgi:flagellar motor switch protein FliM